MQLAGGREIAEVALPPGPATPRRTRVSRRLPWLRGFERGVGVHGSRRVGIFRLSRESGFTSAGGGGRRDLPTETQNMTPSSRVEPWGSSCRRSPRGPEAPLVSAVGGDAAAGRIPGRQRSSGWEQRRCPPLPAPPRAASPAGEREGSHRPSPRATRLRFHSRQGRRSRMGSPGPLPPWASHA